MVNEISTMYTTILADIATEMKIYCKADTKEFEQIPAIGLGIPRIEDLEVTGRPHAIVVTIPILIADAGADPLVNVNLSAIYTDLRNLFYDTLAEDLSDEGAESIILGTFQEVPYSGIDNAIRCLGGEVKIVLDITPAPIPIIIEDTGD